MKKFTKLLQLMMLMLLMSTVAFGQAVISTDAETESFSNPQEQEYDLLKLQYLQSQQELTGVEEAEAKEEEVLTQTLATGETVVLTSEQKEALESAGYMSEGEIALESVAQVSEILGEEIPELEEGTGQMDKEQFAAGQPAFGIDNKVFPAQTLLNPDGSGTVTLGTGATYNTTVVHPTPYGTYYKNHRVQYLILASELTSIGMVAGNITAIGFNVQNVNTCSPMPNYTMKVKGTTATQLTTVFDNGTYLTVWTNPNFLPGLGWNTHTFTAPFYWDGVANVLIDVCFDIIPGDYTQNASVYYTEATGMANSYRSDAVVACGTTSAATVSPNRANMQITGEVADCLPPIGLYAANLTTTSANVGWTDINTPPATQWDIKYGAPGFDPQTGGTLISPVTANPYNLTGLTILTAYEFYVRADCGTKATSLWAGPYAFQTTSNPLSGNYTINSAVPTGGSNFQSFTDFATAINPGGLSGAVVVNVVAGSGPYTEQVMFGEFPNSSAVNTVTINGNNEKLQFLSTNTNERATLKFNGTDYTTVNNLVVEALGSISGDYGWAVWLTNNADYNTFSGCQFIATTTATLTNFAAFVTSSSATGATTSGAAASNLKVLNCVATGGYYGMVINGPTTAPYAESAVVTGNVIKDFYLYGLYLRGQNNGNISGNQIVRPTRASNSTYYGIYMASDFTGTSITKNRMYDMAVVGTTTSTVYGFYGSSVTATSGQDLLIANNAIYGTTGMNGTQYGMYLLTTDNVKIYHNTISLDNVTHPGSSLIRGIHHSGNLATIDIRNNIISVTTNSTGIKYCLYFAQTAGNEPILTSNYNVLHMGATAGTNHIAYWSATSYTTLANWQVLGFDLNSQNAEPLFVNPAGGNLKPTNASINNMGTNLLAFVPDDILGVARTTTPDPGAWEFDPPACPPPSGQYAANIGQNSANLGWTENGTAPNWEIELGPAGFTPTGLPTQAVNTNPYTYTGLSPLTSYDWYVRAKCSPFSVSSWVGPHTFQTYSAPLSGTYTINSAVPTGGTNFQSFNDFALAINAGGPSGAVTVNVVTGSGPYNEQVMLGVLPNSSVTNTVTINGNGETLQFLSTNTNERATLKFDGTDYVIVNNLLVKALGELTTPAEYGWAVWLTNGADNNTFSGCTFMASETATSSNFNPFVTSNSATGATTAALAASNLKVLDCEAVGGYYGMVINGPSSAPYSAGNVISGNVIRDFYYYGLYVRGQNNSQFIGNEVHRTNRTNNSITYMTYFNGNLSNTEISKNIIYNVTGTGTTTTSSGYGIYFTSVTNPAGEGFLLANNAVYGWEGRNAGQYGIYTTSFTAEAKFYHNTISLDHVGHPGSSVIYCLYQSGASTGLDIKNNIFSYTTNSTGTKYNMYFATSTAVVSSNYNVLYRGATAGTNNTGYWASTPYNTLTNWQAANGGIYDQNSSDAEPLFANPANGNLMPTNGSINNMGANLLAFVPDDILGVARTATPDPGAWEFVPPACPQPSALTAINVTSNSANLDWTENGTATIWDIELGVSGFIPTGTPTIAGISVKPHTVPGLIPETSYDWYVRANCGVEQSGWSGPHTFTTLCAALVAPFFEPFQNTVIPNCWTMSGPQSWLFTTTWPGYGATGLTDHTGTGGSFAGVDGSGTAGITGITLESPMIDVSALTNPALRFYLFNNNTQADPALYWQSLRVDLWDGAAWNNSIFYWGPTDNNPNWVEVSVSLATYTITGDIQFRFVVDKSTGSPFYDDLIIDDVEVFDQLANDASTASIDVPEFITGTGTFSPMATVKNNGANPATFNVQMTITDGYTSTVTVTSLAAGASQQVTFGPWTPSVGNWTINVCTYLTGDEDPTNDCLNQKAFVRVLDKEVYAYRSYITPQGPVKFNLNNPSGIQLIENTAALSTPYAGAWVKGFWYASESASPYNLVVFNHQDGSRVPIGPSGLAVAINGMAYDATTSTMYTITSTDLYTMDLTTGAVTLVAPLTLSGTTPVNLACSPAGMLYTVTLSDDVFHSLNKTTGVGTAIGHIGTDINFAQDMEFDPETGDLYMAAYSGGGTGNLRFVDVTTGLSYFIGWFGAGPGSSAELTAFAIPYGNELTGKMLYNNNAAKPMNNSEVIISNGTVERRALTDCDGNYSFFGLDGNYSLTGYSDKERGGTTITDVVRTRQAMSGLWTFTTLEALAADVSGGGITITDVVLMRQKMSGIATPGWIAPNYVFEIQSVVISGAPVVQNVPTLSSGDPDGSFTPPVTCLEPTGLGVASVGLTSVDLVWASNSGSSNIQWGVAGFAFGTGTTINGVTSPYTLGGLTQTTSYDFYVQDVCCVSGTSAWVGPYNFTTAAPAPAGTDCSNPVYLTTGMFPYVQTGLTTCGFIDNYDYTTHPGSCYYYINGEDFVYEYTPVANITLNIVLTNTLTWTGITVSQGCPDVGTCVGYSGSTTGNPSYLGLSLTGGVTYYIIVSTWPTPDCTPFDISITVAP